MKTSNEKIIDLIDKMDMSILANLPGMVRKLLATDVDEEDLHNIVCGNTEPYTDEFTARASYNNLKTAIELGHTEIVLLLITHQAPLLNLSNKYVPPIDALTVIARTIYEARHTIDPLIPRTVFEYSTDKDQAIQTFCTHFQEFLAQRTVYYTHTGVDNQHDALLMRIMEILLTASGTVHGHDENFARDLMLMDEAVFGRSHPVSLLDYHDQWMERFLRLYRMTSSNSEPTATPATGIERQI